MQFLAPTTFGTGSIRFGRVGAADADDEIASPALCFKLDAGFNRKQPLIRNGSTASRALTKGNPGEFKNQTFGCLLERPERGASKGNFLSVSVSVRLALACVISTLAASTHGQPLLLKTETFDVDPGWDGRNNRATDPAPRKIVQNFRFSSFNNNAGGPAGESFVLNTSSA